MKGRRTKYWSIAIGLSMMITTPSLAQAPDPFQSAPGPAPVVQAPRRHPTPPREAEPAKRDPVVPPIAVPVAPAPRPAGPPLRLADTEDYREITCTDSKIYLSQNLKCYFSSHRPDRQSIDCSNFRYSTEGTFGKYLLSFRLKFVNPAGPGCWYGENTPQEIVSEEPRVNASGQPQRIGEYDTVGFTLATMSCLSFSRNMQPQLGEGGGKHSRHFYMARYAQVIFGYICKQEPNPLGGDEFQAVLQSLQIRV